MVGWTALIREPRLPFLSQPGHGVQGDVTQLNGNNETETRCFEPMAESPQLHGCTAARIAIRCVAIRPSLWPAHGSFLLVSYLSLTTK